jgi:hypothetical protein
MSAEVRPLRETPRGFIAGYGNAGQCSGEYAAGWRSQIRLPEETLEQAFEIKVG